MGSFDEDYWSDLIDYVGLLDDVAAPADVYWSPQPQSNVGVAVDASLNGNTSKVSDSTERECPRKRGRGDPSGGVGAKACRERMRREKLNDLFSQLSAILELGKPVKTDKLAILGDAIRLLKQRQAESKECEEMNKMLLEEIKSLKAERNELREEKVTLKADKERMEQQLKSMNVPLTGFMPPHPPLYQAGINKVPVFPSYGFVPMWHYLPQSVRDTSQDHELRPPAA